MQNDTKHYWFKRRRYGFGWIPVTWQGWLSLLLPISAVIAAAWQLPPKHQHASLDQLLSFFGIVAAAIVFFVVIGYRKGPRPHWRWGAKPGDDPDEDS